MTDKIYIQIGDEKREATAQEASEILETQESFNEKQEALQAEQEAKIASRESALAKLAALGLTEDEIAAL
jgi:DNA-binding NarL/FixJ family response regulator